MAGAQRPTGSQGLGLWVEMEGPTEVQMLKMIRSKWVHLRCVVSWVFGFPLSHSLKTPKDVWGWAQTVYLMPLCARSQEEHISGPCPQKVKGRSQWELHSH